MEYILITGAYGGMGAATARAFADRGYGVLALDRRVGEPYENVIPIEVDITSEEGVQTAMAQVREHTDRLFAVIHFAGIYMLDSLVELEAADFRRIVDVNLYGAYLINRAAMPLLHAGSRIIITTSELATLDPLPFTGIYAVTKGALDKYAFSLRMELQLLDIHVSVLRAGAVDTGMLGVSTAALDSFVNKTRLYNCNAARFKRIVDRVEAKCVPADRIARRVVKIAGRRRPAFAYSVNRNPLLRMLGILPKGLQLRIIKWVLK